MSQFRNRVDGTVVTDSAFRNMFPDVGFPAVLDAACLDAYGFDPVLNAPQPECSYGKLVLQTEPVQDSAGNWVTGWTVADMDANSLATIKAADQQRVWEAIKAERDRRKAGGLMLTVDGKEYWFWMDEPTRNQYALLDSKIRRSSIPLDVKLADWKTMSGEFVVFTGNLLYTIMDTGIDREIALFGLAEQKRQALMAVENPNVFEWNGGWPQTYEEWAAAQEVDEPKPEVTE